MSEIAKMIDEVLALGLSPLLKSAGFRKKGRNYYRKPAGAGVIHLIGIQASRGNIGDQGRFYVNVCVHFPVLHAIQTTRPDVEWPKDYECTFRKRLATGGDGELSRTTDLAVAAQQLRDGVEQDALPWLEANSTLLGLQETLRRPDPFRGPEKSLLADVALALGDREEARRLGLELLADLPGAGSNIRFWARRNGLDLG